MCDLTVSAPRNEDREAWDCLFSLPCRDFLTRLLLRWEPEVEQILLDRRIKKCLYDKETSLPDFPASVPRQDQQWKVSPLPKRLLRRHLDLGDVSPSETERFLQCLQQDVDGIQTDFDDGHCPTWHNQIQGWWNIYRHVHGLLPSQIPRVEEAPVLMLRPRAWNMTEHNIMVRGRETSGPLVDFGILMFHNAKLLQRSGTGPFFYLSKLEGSKEAALWNRIFVWTQTELGLSQGTIKACVLIENVFAAFEMEEILWELREHSAGLNCGMWDYSASFINKFGDRPEFQLPDRSKYVSMERSFLASYMRLVVQTCRRRGAPATGGMAAQVLVPGNEEGTTERVVAAKRKEIQAGVEGFMVYDFGLVSPCRKLWAEARPEISVDQAPITAQDLLTLPGGGVTVEGLNHNVEVGVMFIASWLQGKGVMELRGCVEDSATAEISRSQVWQWIRHRAILEETGDIVTVAMVREMVIKLVLEHSGQQEVTEAAWMFLDLVSMRNFPEFVTTLLSDSREFRRRHVC